jgi:hypothetical protein
MARVKMNAKHEYEFVANFKVMQNVFKAKKIDKACFSSRQRVNQTHFYSSNAAYTHREACQMQDAVR